MSVISLIEADGVKLTRQGKTFRGRCPFHSGKTQMSLLWTKMLGNIIASAVINTAMLFNGCGRKGVCPFLKLASSSATIRNAN